MNNLSPASEPATNPASPTPDPDALVQFHDVSFLRNRRALLSHVTWKVEMDERWVIIGPNGAGKTTLMRLAAAEEFPSSGVIWLLGEQIGRTDMRDLRAMIGMSSAALASRIPEDEKVSDLVVSAGYAILGRWREEYNEDDAQRTIDVLTQVGAAHLAERSWGTLSEGERKRVLIARSLMANPELLLLDEPSAGMDLGGREDLVSYLGQLALDPDAPAIVMVTHHVEEIPYGFTHALLLDQGGVVAQGLINEVLTSENLSKTFQQPIRVDQLDGRFFARRIQGE
ncbi:MAG: ABC transporter ATP-binding protein [Corynebacterium sp.]|nr:ABC transporter ATP-binding protein [Corynebacterium sp.]